MDRQSTLRRVLPAAAAVGAILLAAVLWKRKKQKQRLLDQGVVAQLWLYPVKSAGGMQVQSWPITPSGLKFDREWVIIRASDSTIFTLRECSTLKQIRPTVDLTLEELSLAFPDGATFQISAKPLPKVAPEDLIMITKSGITGGYAKVNNRALDAKLSEFTSTPVFLARCHLPRRNPHDTDKYQAAKLCPVTTAVQGQDFSALHVCTEAGLQWVQNATGVETDLNLTAFRFRTNIVFRVTVPTLAAESGSVGRDASPVALSEDKWDEFVVGEIPFYASKRCARCPVTTISKEGAVHPQSEPLRTLGERHFIAAWPGGPSKPIFGLNAFPAASGTIAVGDRFHVVSTIASD